MSQQGRARGPQRATRSSGRGAPGGHPTRMVVRGRVVRYALLAVFRAYEFVFISDHYSPLFAAVIAVLLLNGRDEPLPG